MSQCKRFLAFLIIIAVASGLAPQHLTYMPIILGSVEKVTWKTFRDSADRFTIQYPSKWEANNSTDPLGPIDVEFWYHGDTSTAPNTYAYVTLIAWPNFRYFTSTQGMLKNDQVTVESEAENYKLEQGAECSSYIINGVQGCSIIYSLSFPDQPYARNALVVDAVDNTTGVQYSMGLIASEDVFEQFRPVFDHMVNSFELSHNAFAG